MNNKGKKKVHECIWYKYEYDDFGKYHVCEKDCTKCEFKGIVSRQHCPKFKKNDNDFVYIKVNDDFNSKTNKARKSKLYKLERIKNLCEQQKDVLDSIIKLVEDMQNA